MILTIVDTNSSGASRSRLLDVTPTQATFGLYDAGGAATPTEEVHYIAFEELR